MIGYRNGSVTDSVTNGSAVFSDKCASDVELVTRVGHHAPWDLPLSTVEEGVDGLEPHATRHGSADNEGVSRESQAWQHD